MPRRRRLRCLPSPAASSISRPPLARLGGNDRLHAPLRDDRVRLLAEAGIGQHLDHVRQTGSGRRSADSRPRPRGPTAARSRSRSAADRRSRRSCPARSPPRPRCAPARRDRRRRSRPASTDPAPRAATARPSPTEPRRSRSTCPTPFGPTTTLTPGPKSRCVRSGKDLKPFNVSDFRRIGFPASFAGQPVHGLSRSLLLGVLLAPAAALAQSLVRPPSPPPRMSGRAAAPVSPVIS